MGQVEEILLDLFSLIYLVMNNLVILLILLLIVLIVIFRAFKPNIDIIQIEDNRYKILIWYNHFRGSEIERRWVKLGEFYIWW